MLEWMKAYRDETEMSYRRTWRSRCRHYIVQESTSKYEKDSAGRPVVRFYAILLPNTILGTHRKKNRAVKTCETHERKKKK
jgi:hypothetical protein